MQFIILLTGALLFVFYQFEKPPVVFNPVELQKLEESSLAGDYRRLEQAYDEAFETRRLAALAMASETDADGLQEARAEFLNADERFSQTREQVKGLISEMNEGETFDDTNYIFPTFVLTQLPAGFVGLILVAILAAAMSTVESELNSLSTATVVDFYRRYVTRDGSDQHYLIVSRVSTLFWGGFATFCALYMGHLGSAIEAVNRIGSYFYGPILGVFVLAIAAPRSNGRGAFWGVLAGFVSILLTSWLSDISFLYYNIVGCLVAVAAGYAISLTASKQSGST
jgi:Na+(H+)/acetate symporter ActP